MKNIFIGVAVALVVIVGFGVVVSSNVNEIVTAVANLNGTLSTISDQSNLGGLSERDVQAVSLKVGASGTRATKHLFGTCNLATTQLALEASSTDAFTCSATGVRSGDVVTVVLPSNSGSVYGGFVVDSVSAGTDSITIGVTNLTGAATSSFPLATTSAMWQSWDN